MNSKVFGKWSVLITSGFYWLSTFLSLSFVSSFNYAVGFKWYIITWFHQKELFKRLHGSLKSTRGAHTVQDTNGMATNTSYIFSIYYSSHANHYNILLDSLPRKCGGPTKLQVLWDVANKIKYIAFSSTNIYHLCDKFN